MHEYFLSFFYFFYLHIPPNIYGCKDKNIGKPPAFRNSQEPSGDKKEDNLESPGMEQDEEVKLDSHETGTTHIDQEQEESSMWQKCPVITFQTFDDLTGWLI